MADFKGVVREDNPIFLFWISFDIFVMLCCIKILWCAKKKNLQFFFTFSTFLIDNSGFPHFSGSEEPGQPPSANWYEKVIAFLIYFTA